MLKLHTLQSPRYHIDLSIIYTHLSQRESQHWEHHRGKEKAWHEKSSYPGFRRKLGIYAAVEVAWFSDGRGRSRSLRFPPSPDGRGRKAKGPRTISDVWEWWPLQRLSSHNVKHYHARYLWILKIQSAENISFGYDARKHGIAGAFDVTREDASAAILCNGFLVSSFLWPQAAQAHYLWVRASEVIVWSECTRIISVLSDAN